jgi:hypothetical protein
MGLCIPFYFDTRVLVFQGLSPCDTTCDNSDIVTKLSSIMRMETLVSVNHTAWCHIHEDSNCHSQHHENIRSHGTSSVLSLASEVTGCRVNYHDSVTGRVTENFSLHHYIQNHMGTDSASVQWIWVTFLCEVVQGMKHSPPSSRKDENGRTLPHAFIVWNLRIDITFSRMNPDDSRCLNFCKFLKSGAAEKGMWPILRCLHKK